MAAQHSKRAGILLAMADNPARDPDAMNNSSNDSSTAAHQTSMLERRPASPADLPFLLQLRQQTFHAYLAEAGLPIDADSDLARVMFKFDVAEILLHKGAAAGLLKISRSGPICQDWQIHQLQIVPALQGRGLGATLLRQLQGEAAEAGVGLSLGVLKRNPAQALYRRLSFADCGENELEYLLRWSRDTAVNPSF